MNDASLAQGNEILNLILRKKLPKGRVQFLLESGIFGQLFDLPAEELSNMSALNKGIMLARLQWALGMLPRIKIVEQHHLQTYEFGRPIGKSINEMFEQIGVKCRIAEQLSFSNRSGGIKPPMAEFSLIEFPLFPRGKRPMFSPYIVLAAVGFLNADVYDLVSYSKVLSSQTMIAERPIAALNSVARSSTGETGAGFIYDAYPTIQVDLDKKAIWYDGKGLRDFDCWHENCLYLVRNRSVYPNSVINYL